MHVCWVNHPSLTRTCQTIRLCLLSGRSPSSSQVRRTRCPIQTRGTLLEAHLHPPHSHELVVRTCQHRGTLSHLQQGTFPPHRPRACLFDFLKVDVVKEHPEDGHNHTSSSEDVRMATGKTSKGQNEQSIQLSANYSLPLGQKQSWWHILSHLGLRLSQVGWHPPHD